MGRRRHSERQGSTSSASGEWLAGENVRESSRAWLGPIPSLSSMRQKVGSVEAVPTYFCFSLVPRLHPVAFFHTVFSY